jgi:hypothetical protein
MGRPEAPLDGREGPLREFAARLRRLREESGGRSYRQLAKSANFAAPTLARAASGRSLPSWEVTRAYVAACGGDPEQWRPAWTATARLVSAGRLVGCQCGADRERLRGLEPGGLLDEDAQQGAAPAVGGRAGHHGDHQIVYVVVWVADYGTSNAR